MSHTNTTYTTSQEGLDMMTDLIEKLFKIFEIVGYTQEEIPEKTAQFISILEQRIMTAIDKRLSPQERVEIAKLSGQLAARDRVQPEELQKAWERLILAIRKSLTEKEYTLLLNNAITETLSEYLSHILPSFTQSQRNSLEKVLGQ